MVAAVRVHKNGSPEVLTFEQVEVPEPGSGQIRIKQHACGVNFIDTYFRMGMIPSPVGLPFVSGNEGAGEVIAVGPGVAEASAQARVSQLEYRRGTASIYRQLGDAISNGSSNRTSNRPGDSVAICMHVQTNEASP